MDHNKERCGYLNEKKILEKWLKQLQQGDISPEALGYHSSKEEAIIQIKQQIHDLKQCSRI